MSAFRSALSRAIGVAVRTILYAITYVVVGREVVGMHRGAEPMWLYVGHVLTWPTVPLNEVVRIWWLFMKYVIAAGGVGLVVLIVIAMLALVPERKK